MTPTLYASTLLDLLTVSVTSRMRVMGKLAKVICKHDVIALRSNITTSTSTCIIMYVN